MKKVKGDEGGSGSAGHPSAIAQAGFLEKREKWRTPSYFGPCQKQTWVILPR
jgi:hypothetical protein